MALPRPNGPFPSPLSSLPCLLFLLSLPHFLSLSSLLVSPLLSLSHFPLSLPSLHQRLPPTSPHSAINFTPVSKLHTRLHLSGLTSLHFTAFTSPLSSMSPFSLSRRPCSLLLHLLHPPSSFFFVGVSFSSSFCAMLLRDLGESVGEIRGNEWRPKPASNTRSILVNRSQGPLSAPGSWRGLSAPYLDARWGSA